MIYRYVKRMNRFTFFSHNNGMNMSCGIFGVVWSNNAFNFLFIYLFVSFWVNLNESMCFFFRLEHANCQLTPLMQKADILRRTSLRYKQRLERRYSDLQKAEAEVCLLKLPLSTFYLCAFWKFRTWFSWKWYYGYLLHVFILLKCMCWRNNAVHFFPWFFKKFFLAQLCISQTCIITESNTGFLCFYKSLPENLGN